MSVKKIQGLDAIKSLLIVYIVFAHFITFWTKNPFIIRFFKQHNLVVGIFFVLSGFVLSFSKEKGAELWPFLKSRLKRVYPLHAAILVTFLPLFAMIDLHYGSFKEFFLHGVLSFSLLQSWFPEHAVIWNGPTWFLSSLVFCYVVFPLLQKKMHAMKASQLLTLIIVIQVFSFMLFSSYANYKGWAFLEEVNAPASVLFNLFRFNPLLNAMEFILGMAICNLWKTKSFDLRHSGKISTIVACVLIMLLLATPSINHLYLRSQVFIPLFCFFLYALCWQQGAAYKFLSHKYWDVMSPYSFCLYLVHVPVGMLFYKKVIAKQIFSSFPHASFYFLAILIFTIVFHHGVEKKLFVKSLKQRQQKI